VRQPGIYVAARYGEDALRHMIAIKGGPIGDKNSTRSLSAAELVFPVGS
jgi:hypothetical protein